jgi:hypothetical protein
MVATFVHGLPTNGWWVSWREGRGGQINQTSTVRWKHQCTTHPPMCPIRSRSGLYLCKRRIAWRRTLVSGAVYSSTAATASPAESDRTWVCSYWHGACKLQRPIASGGGGGGSCMIKDRLGYTACLETEPTDLALAGSLASLHAWGSELAGRETRKASYGSATCSRRRWQRLMQRGSVHWSLIRAGLRSMELMSAASCFRFH